MGFDRLTFFFVYVTLFTITNGSATITSFTCVAGPNLCQNLYCNTTLSPDKAHQLNCGCFLPTPLYYVTLEVQLQRKRGGKYVKLLNIKEDLHTIVKQSAGNPAMSKLFSASKGYLTGFSYPFKGNMTVRKMPVLLNYASVFLQSSTYRLQMEFAGKDELILRTLLDFVIGNNKKQRKKN